MPWRTRIIGRSGPASDLPGAGSMSSDASEPLAPYPSPPTRPPAYPPRPPARGSSVLGCLFGISMLCNVIGFVIIILGSLVLVSSIGSGEGPSVHEHLHSGNNLAGDKIAIVHLD